MSEGTVLVWDLHDQKQKNLYQLYTGYDLKEEIESLLKQVWKERGEDVSELVRKHGHSIAALVGMLARFGVGESPLDLPHAYTVTPTVASNIVRAVAIAKSALEELRASSERQAEGDPARLVEEGATTVYVAGVLLLYAVSAIAMMVLNRTTHGLVPIFAEHRYVEGIAMGKGIAVVHGAAPTPQEQKEK